VTSSFAQLGISTDVVRVLEAMRIVEPTPIQMAVIPDALAGRDVLGRAPTGSGKTFGFGLPLLELVHRASPRRPRGLVLAPTRELAEQIKRELQPVAVALERSLVAIYGGVGMGKQTAALRKGVDVVIATPGRLIDLLEQGELSLDQVDKVVVDEADRMADMGFLPDVRHILDLTSPKRQTVMFSATLDKAVAVLTDHYQRDPVTHRHGSDEPDITQMSHRFIEVAQSDKVALAADIIDSHGTTMVFCRTRHGVDRVCRQLKRKGVKAGWIHGGRSQNQRDAALLAFTDGRIRALIATDVAARGIHVDEVACVLHYDPPADPKDYVHRSGRTARAGSAGDVICFVTPEQTKKVLTLQRQVGLKVKIEKGAAPQERSGHSPVTDHELGLGSKPQPRKANKGKAAPRRRAGNNQGGGSKRSTEDIDSRRSKSRSAEEATGSGASPTGPSRKRSSAKKRASAGDSRSKGKASTRRSGKPRPKSKSHKNQQFKSRSKRRRG
jgi:superfamily II DNA/RNA helicase